MDHDPGATARAEFAAALEALERIASHIDGDDYECLAIGMLAAGQAINIAYPPARTTVQQAILDRLSRLDPDAWAPHAATVKALRRRGYALAAITEAFDSLASEDAVESVRTRIGSRRAGTFYRLVQS